MSESEAIDYAQELTEEEAVYYNPSHDDLRGTVILNPRRIPEVFAHFLDPKRRFASVVSFSPLPPQLSNRRLPPGCLSHICRESELAGLAAQAETVRAQVADQAEKRGNLVVRAQRWTDYKLWFLYGALSGGAGMIILDIYFGCV